MIEILKKFDNKELKDVSVYGVVDMCETPAEFIPFLDSIYLEIGESTIRLMSEETDARIKITESAEYELRFELETGHAICRSSFGKFVLNNPNADNRVKHFTLHDEYESSVGALEVSLHSGQVLFFDPAFFDGINFGGIEQRKIWYNQKA